MASDNRTRRESRSYTFTVSTSDMAWTCVGAVFALTVFFLFGVLVGRGYLPTETETVAQTDVTLQAPEEAAAPGALSGNDGAADDSAAPTALKAEDLAYQDQLDKPAPTVTEPVAESAAEPAAEQAAAVAASAEQVAEQVKETPQADPDQYDSANLPAPEPGEQVYHYTYQAAAFKDEAAASELAAKLKEQGMEAVVVKGVTSSATWYRVQLPFTGTPSQTRPLRDAVQKVTNLKPVMVSKKGQ